MLNDSQLKNAVKFLEIPTANSGIEQYTPEVHFLLTQKASLDSTAVYLKLVQ